ncbi:SCO3374 family protein [Streptomyces sp. NPDC048297]|uniref:SCO3374 family protein n=1 Tax=Streptomyces sp. NPDC048297 TaxID=3365531 RepID=UPI003717D306
MAGSVPLISTVPPPRRPSDPGPGPTAGARHWYENELRWATVPGRPLRLVTGVRFDVLDVPAEAGAAALRHLAAGSPVALRGERMRLLVAAGSAEQLPELLDWLEWGPLDLDLRTMGAGGLMEAPARPERSRDMGPPPVRDRTGAASAAGESAGSVQGAGSVRGADAVQGAGSVRGADAVQGAGSVRGADAVQSAGSVRGAGSVQGAAVWLRPPEPGCELETSLPALPAVGGAPDLVRLVDTVAAQCHRVRLRRLSAGPPALRRDQPLAFS